MQLIRLRSFIFIFFGFGSTDPWLFSVHSPFDRQSSAILFPPLNWILVSGVDVGRWHGGGDERRRQR